jgi:hypothetical protein
MKRVLFFFYFISYCLISNPAFAQRIGHSGEEWKIIKTEHFDIIVNANQLDLGRYYAFVSEKAYKNLAQVFTHMTEKIVIIVNDTTDVPNGYATRIPYPHIMAYAVVAGDHDSLSESGDWASILITHELTHILQFEPATGVYSTLRPIFGNVIAPNMLMPSWWKEGMAVEIETQFSDTGRTRSVYQDAVLRSFVLEEKMDRYDLPQANETLPSWPYGNRPYLFGSLFFSQLIAETKDLKSVNFLASRQGERAPYFIEKPMNELTGQNYESTYIRALRTAEEFAQIDTLKLKEQPTSEVKFVNEPEQSSARPTISQAHGLIAYLKTVEDENFVNITDLQGVQQNFKKLPKGSIQSLAFHPTQKKLLLTKIDSVNSKYFLSDLYEHDLESEKTTQLTFSARVRSARYSEDGKQAALLTTEGGQTQIRLMDLETKAIQFIITSTLSNRYESVIFWDNNTLLANKLSENGSYSLVKIDLTNKTETSVALDYKKIRFMRKVKDSLYFVSSQNGVNNLYVSTDLITAKPVTNITTGLWSFDVVESTNEIIGSVMTGSGFRVARVSTFENLTELPVIENSIAKRYTNKSVEFTTSTTQETSYEPGSYLWPSYWIPFVSTSSSSRGLFVQAQTDGFDPLKLHRYAVVASYDSELQRGNFNGAYINSVYDIPFKLSSVVQSHALGSFANIVQQTSHSISLLPDLFSLNKSLAAEIGYQAVDTNFFTSTQHHGPYVQVTYKDYDKNIFEISPESGWGTSVRFEHLQLLNDETNSVGKDFDRSEFSVLGFYRLKKMPEHHAIKARLSGLLSFQNISARYGSSSSSGFLAEDSLLPQFVNRGYASAQFYGRNIWNANLEYRFPFSTVETGSGTDAYYFKRISGALVADALGVEGFGLGKDLAFYALSANESIWSTGVELKLESTIGYILPMNFVLGFYLPHSNKFADSAQFGLSLQIGSLF